MVEKLFRHLMNEVFPGLVPFDLQCGPALGPLRTELLGLKRNHARDQIRLNEMCEEHYAGRTFFLPGRVIATWLPKTAADMLQEKQDRRERRIEEIVAKLARDCAMAKCQ
jgi:hypothetical protein